MLCFAYIVSLGQDGPVHEGQEGPYVLSHTHIVTMYQLYYT